MRHVTRFSMLSIACVLAVSSLAGCAEKSGETAAGNTGQPAVSSKPATVNLVVNNGSRKYQEGLDANNNEYIQYIRDNSGVDVRLTELAADGYQDKLNVLLASGESYDMINSTDMGWVMNLVEQKGIQPLNEVLEKYGQDIKKNLPQEAWDKVTFNGKIYAIPAVTTKLSDEIMYVRKDWLDRLGLKPPATLDEFTAVMKAFVQQDPDGNGKADTLGMLIGGALIRTGPFFGAFGVPFSSNSTIKVNSWVEREGKLVNALVLPETKAALQYMAGLYADKVIDPEWALNKQKNIEEKVASGKAGIFSAKWFETKQPTVILGNMNNDPKAQWIALPYPVGPGGKSGIGNKDLVISYNVVPAKSGKAAEVVKALNFMYGAGHETLKMGLPQHNIWSRADNKLKVDLAAHEKHIYRGVLEFAGPWDAELEGERLEAMGPGFHINDNIKTINDNIIPSAFTGSPTPALGKYGSQLNTMMEETFTKIIMGSLPLSEFDKFVESFKKNGGDQMTEEVNAWYQSSKKK